LTGEIERAARAVTGEEIADPELVRQVVHAAHAAIALVFLTEYKRLVVIDPQEASDPAATVAAVAHLYGEHPRELRPWLARQAAIKVAVYSATVD
jgi:Mlc titration factor MtfA (ptsG expression regulator)